jgi:hypothetical protein
MKSKKTKVKRVAAKKAAEQPYKKYESHPFWQRIYDGISDLIENHDLVERNARKHIVGQLFKALRPKKKRNKPKKARARSRRSRK